MRKLMLCGCCLFAAATLLNDRAQADAVADFYRGRNVTVIVGYSAGGGYDLYARALARHMGKHVPGNPTFIVQNMHGAGSLNAANYLYNVAPKDGISFGTFARGLAMEPLIGTAKVMFDATKYTWLGSGTNEVSVCATWKSSPIKTWEDALAKPFAVAGEGLGSDPDTFALMMRNEFGTKLKLITGYPGTSDMNIAIERGEVDGRCGWSWSSVMSTRGNWVKEKKIHILVQLALQKHADLPDVPLVTEQAKNLEQKQILTLIFARQALGRPYLAPPGIPADRAATLRKAFMDTMKDKEFLAEAEKAQLEITPIDGEALQKLVSDVYATPPEIAKKAAEALK